MHRCIPNAWFYNNYTYIQCLIHRHSLHILYSFLCTADVTVELNATTARFSWPLVTSAQVPVLGYTISIEAVDPPGLISIAPVNTLPQQNSHLQSGLEEGVRYRFLLHATTSLQQDMLVPNQHEGEFTTDTAGIWHSFTNAHTNVCMYVYALYSNLRRSFELVLLVSTINHYKVAYRACK